MQTCAKNLRLLTTVLAVVFFASLLHVSARAANAADIAHRLLRNKILREAGDRYDVRFLSTHTDRLPGGGRNITGRGRFRRHGKSSQTFTYHAAVDRRNHDVNDVGYDLR